MHNQRERKKLRLQDYDYSRDGYYYITICTKNREEFFGEIQDGKMILNEYGRIVYHNWKQIPHHYIKSQIDEFVVMPNHFHGIIIIDNTPKVGNENFRSLQMNDINPYHETNLSNIIKGFKIGCTKQIRNNFEDYNFQRQKSFYDKIIKNKSQLHKTREYIVNNPLKRHLDTNNPKNL